MSGHDRTDHSAAASAMGYLYQVRYALLEALRRLRRDADFVVSIETLDDVVFEESGGALELLQLKHRVNRAADLSDASTDLWKTIRVWSEALLAEELPDGALLFLITTGHVSDGAATHYLRADSSRDVAQAIERLNSIASSSNSTANAAAYQAFRSLDAQQRKRLLSAAVVVDLAPDIADLDANLRDELFHAVERRFLDSLLQRLEGWWYRRVIAHLTEGDPRPILSNELNSELTSVREQFRQDSLPIDDDIMSASVDASGYQNRSFVRQLRLIDIGNRRILHAIKNYFRAFEQRSRWVREDLLLVGELGRYEDRLVEEWEVLFEQMRDNLDDDASGEAKRSAAQVLYQWVETGMHPQIRDRVSEPAISRGSYQILSDDQRVGWHLEFKDRLQQLLEQPEPAE